MSKKKIITQEQIDDELKRIEDEANEKKKAIISEAQKARDKKVNVIKNMIQEIFLPKVENLQKDLFKLNKRNLQKTLTSINLTFTDTEEKEKIVEEKIVTVPAELSADEKRLLKLGQLVEKAAGRKIGDLNAFNSWILTQKTWIKG